MVVDNLKMVNTIIGVILKAEHAGEDELKSARSALLKLVGKIGARRFVDIAASILKNNFKIEGCNDARIPLKRIFAISLDELESQLSGQRYDLADGHPLSMLSADHKENIVKLKALRFSLGKLNLNNETPASQIKEKLKEVKDYFAELDLHIRKEEEVLFPALESSDMKEHPQNLREEHKNFREILSKIIRILDEATSNGLNLAFERVSELKEKFISDISNHIFRETYIFYPASLEFITEENKWTKIKEGFESLNKNNR